jgi:tyrosinase
MTRVRREVWKLGAGWNDTLVWYARAVRALQSRPVTDSTSWWFLAAIHGMHPVVWSQFGVISATTPLPTAAAQLRFWNQCQHQSWYFLPWHRGYLAAFESVVRDAIVNAGGPPDWALPYWDYSDPAHANARAMPDAFDLAKLPDGTDNPLRVDRRFGAGTKPIQIPDADVLLTALQDDEFPGGDSDIPPGFGGPETVFHHGPESETTNGGLEALPHNAIHGDIGGFAPGGDPNRWQDLGLMSMPITAALDPIFWLHHANIDRLWNVWLRVAHTAHVNPDKTTWLDGPADRVFVMPKADHGEWTFTARDMLDTAAPALDYIYDDEAAPAVEPRVTQRLKRLGAGVAISVASEQSEHVTVAKRKTSEPIGSSDGPVHITGTTDVAVRLDVASTRTLRRNIDRVAAAGAAELAGTASPAEPPRVFLKLEGIRGTGDAANYHVYVGLPADADPAEHRDRLVGVLSLFGVSAASDPNGPMAGSGVNQVLEITDIVDALHLSGDDLSGLDVRFVPANPAADLANVSIRRMSVFKLGE